MVFTQKFSIDLKATKSRNRKVYNMIIPMRKMKIKQKGTINSINAKGELGKRIRDMGIVPGTEFIIIGKAPLYDPVALKMKGFVLTLRNSEADFITCEVEDHHA